jgi:UDP-N-acetylglucosamine 2-epimerase (non-hydrolysing)
MIDTLFDHLPRARALEVPGRYGLERRRYAILTLHRPSNVDLAPTLEEILRAVVRISSRIPVIFPVHPRTERQLQATGLGGLLRSEGDVRISAPLGYLEFLSLLDGARLMLTDSGGLQEETTALGIPCLTLRENTERPVTISEGTNVLVGTDGARIVAEAERALASVHSDARMPELWDGKAAGRVRAAVCARVPG